MILINSMPVPLPSLTQVRSRPLAMRGASAVAAVPGTMYLAEDDEGIYRLRRGRLTLWAPATLHDALGDLEGLATDAAGRHVWALAEESGQVIRVSTRGTRRVAVPLGWVARPGQRRNKGWEGRVSVFRLRELAQTHEFELPPPAKDSLADLADVTIDPVTGALLLLSEESRRIAVCRVAGEGLSLESLTAVHVEEAERPEGIDFVTPSRLLVVTEGPARIIEFRVTRPRS